LLRLEGVGKIASANVEIAGVAVQTVVQRTTAIQLTISVAVVVVTALIPTFIATSYYGIGLQPDSVEFITAARSFQRGMNFVMMDGAPLTLFAPGYPFLLAITSHLAGSLESAALSINIVAIVVIEVTLYLILLELELSKLVRWLCFIFISLHPAMSRVYQVAKTETVFIALEMLFILNCILIIRSTQLTRYFLLLACFFFCLIFTRFSGIWLLPLGLLAIGSSTKNPINIRAKASCFYFAICTISILVLIGRNYWLDGTFFGPRSHSGDTFAFAIERVRITIFSWIVVSDKLRQNVPYFVQTISVVGAVSFAILPSTIRALEKILILCFIFIYIGLLIHAQMSTVLDPINNRFLAPVFIPAAICVFMSIDRTIDGLGLKWIHISAVSIVLIVIAVNYNSYVHSALFIRQLPDWYFSYATRSRIAWDDSFTNQLHDPIFSNEPWLTAYVTNLTVYPIPTSTCVTLSSSPASSGKRVEAGQVPPWCSPLADKEFFEKIRDHGGSVVWWPPQPVWHEVPQTIVGGLLAKRLVETGDYSILLIEATQSNRSVPTIDRQ